MSYCDDKTWPAWPKAPWPHTFAYRRDLSTQAAKYFCTCTRAQLLELYDKNYKGPIFDSESLVQREGLRCAICIGIKMDDISKCRECLALHQRWVHPNHCPRYQLCKPCFNEVPVGERCVCYGQEIETSIIPVPEGYVRVMPPKPMSLDEIDDLLEGL